MQNTPIALFKTPVPETDLVGREVLTCILAVKPSNFERPLINIVANVHLSGLSRPGVPPVVWETKDRHSARAHKVLDPIVTAGQRLLLEFLGMSFIYLSSYWILVCVLKVNQLCGMNKYILVYTCTC